MPPRSNLMTSCPKKEKEKGSGNLLNGKDSHREEEAWNRSIKRREKSSNTRLAEKESIPQFREKQKKQSRIPFQKEKESAIGGGGRTQLKRGKVKDTGSKQGNTSI